MLGNTRRLAWYFHTFRPTCDIVLYNKIPDECIRMFETVNELAACAQMANENSYGWIRHQEKPGRMISMGPIGHSICSNYRKPMKILFYLRLVQVRRALRNSSLTLASPASPPLPLRFYSTLGNCQFHCNIGVTPFKNSVIYFLIFFIWFFLTRRYLFRHVRAMDSIIVEMNQILLSKFGERNYQFVHH